MIDANTKIVKAKTWKWCCKLCAVHTRNISLSIRDVIYWKIFVYKDILKIAWIWNGQKRIHVCVKLSILSPWSVLDTGKCFPLVLWDKWATNRFNDSVTFQFLQRTFSWLISFKTKWLYYVYSFVFMWPAMLWLFQCHDKVGMLTFKYDSLFVKCLNVKNVLIAKNNLCHGTHNIGSNLDLIFKIFPLWKISL